MFSDASVEACAAAIKCKYSLFFLLAFGTQRLCRAAILAHAGKAHTYNTAAFLVAVRGTSVLMNGQRGCRGGGRG